MYKAIAISTLAALVAASPISVPNKLVARDPPLSDGVSILDTINKYRDAYSLNELTWSDDVSSLSFTSHSGLSQT